MKLQTCSATKKKYIYILKTWKDNYSVAILNNTNLTARLKPLGNSCLWLSFIIMSLQSLYAPPLFYLLPFLGLSSFLFLNIHNFQLDEQNVENEIYKIYIKNFLVALLVNFWDWLINFCVSSTDLLINLPLLFVFLL